MWSFRSIYSVLLHTMSPRGRESSEAAFQTASLGQVSSLQNYDRKGKSTKQSWRNYCTKAYLHKPAEEPGWCLTFQDQKLHHFESEVTCNRLRGCAMDIQNSLSVSFQHALGPELLNSGRMPEDHWLSALGGDSCWAEASYQCRTVMRAHSFHMLPAWVLAAPLSM